MELSIIEHARRDLTLVTSSNVSINNYEPRDPLSDSNTSSLMVLSVTMTALKPSVVYMEMAVANFIVTYLFPLTVLFGTIGNVTSFAVLMRRRMRTTSVYFFLMVLAVADTVVLYISALKTWIRVITDWELMVYNNSSCRTVSFLILFSQHMAAWTVVLVTVDRFIAVWFPLRATSWCTVTKAYLGTAITALAVAAYSMHSFWTFEVRAGTKSPPRCVPANNSENKTRWFMNGPFQTLMVVTYSGLPFIIILVLNISIVIKLRCTPVVLQSTTNRPTGRHHADDNGERCSMTPVSGLTVNGLQYGLVMSVGRLQGASNARSIQQTRVTYMLLTVSLFYLLLTSPYAVYSLFVPRRASDPHTNAVHHLIKTIFFLLMYLNHAINFILYCVTGRKFRHELKELFVCLCRVRHLGNTSSMRTVRSNCVEMEPLNNESFKLHNAAAATEALRNRVHYYVTDDVIISPFPVSDEDDVIENKDATTA